MGEEAEITGAEKRGESRQSPRFLSQARNWAFIAALVLLILDVVWIALRFSGTS